MNRRECLEAATTAVCFTRHSAYGDAESNFQCIADLWNAIGVSRDGGAVGPVDVALMMVLLKVARQAYTPKDDNWVDIAGYAACGAEVDTPAS